MKQLSPTRVIEVHDLVEPYHVIFEQCFMEGFRDFLKNDARTAHIHVKSTKAAMIRNYIFNRLRIALHNDPNIRFFKQSGMDTIGIKNRVFIRIKKLKRDFRSSNVLTEQVKRLRCGTLELTGIKTKIVWLDVGYMLDATGVFIDSIHAVHPAPNRRGYDFTILISDLAANPNQIQMFTEEEEQNETPLVKIKSHVAKSTVKKNAG